MNSLSTNNFVDFNRIKDYAKNEIFDDKYPEASQEVIGKFEDLHNERISKEQFLSEMRKVLEDCDDAVIQKFVELASPALPPDVAADLHRQHGKPGILKTLLLGVLYLLDPVGAKKSHCDGLSIEVDGRPYDGRVMDPRVEAGCKLITAEKKNLRAPVALVNKSARIHNGVFEPADEKIYLVLKEPNEVSSGMLRDTLRHENHHAKIFKENKYNVPDAEPSANPCLMTKHKTRCEQLFQSVYNKLDKLNTLSREQGTKLFELAQKATGATFHFIFTDSVSNVYKLFGKENVKLIETPGGNEYLITIPSNPHRAYHVLCQCLVNMKVLDLSWYANRYSFNTLNGRERMAAEIEAKLVGHLGENNARQLLGIFEPKLKKLLDEREYSSHHSDL